MLVIAEPKRRKPNGLPEAYAEAGPKKRLDVACRQSGRRGRRGAIRHRMTACAKRNRATTSPPHRPSRAAANAAPARWPAFGLMAHGPAPSKSPSRAREQSAERRRCGSPHLNACLAAARRDAIASGVTRPMTLGARLSALHRGICQTPARALACSRVGACAPKLPWSRLPRRLLWRRLLVAAGLAEFARVRSCKLRPRGTAPVSAFGVPRESALAASQDN